MKLRRFMNYSICLFALTISSSIYAADTQQVTNNSVIEQNKEEETTNINNNIDEYMNIEIEDENDIDGESLEDYTKFQEISKRVYNVQKALKYLKYYEGDLTGVFDDKTLEALILFQNKNNLTVNGKLTTSTLDLIESYQTEVDKLENELFNQKIEEKRKEEELKKIEESKKIVKADAKVSNPARLVDWFKEGQYLLPRKSTFKVTDVATGKSFMAYRMGGTNHCDTEPLTKEDAAIMKSIYKTWSWDRRAIVIEPKNSNVRIAASMAGMPHSTCHIKTNNFNGHFDIHLYNSKTHYDPSNNIYVEKVEPWHQRTLKLAVGK